MAGEGRDETRGGGALQGMEVSLPVIVKELLAGGVAGGVAKSAVAPLERVKILFQTRRAEFQSVGLLGSFLKIVRTEGLLGFYRGNGASVARIVPYAALHYMAYEQYRRWIILAFPIVGRGPVLDLVSGSIAGGTAVIFTCPFDLIHTKLAYQVTPSVLKTGAISLNPNRFLEEFLIVYQRSTDKMAYEASIEMLVLPSVAIEFTMYDVMKLWLKVPSRDDAATKIVSEERSSRPSLHSG